VKHFKNSQQINYSTDHGSSYANRERNSKFFFFSHACRHITVDQSRSSGDRAVKIWILAGTGDTKTVSFTNPHKKKSHGVKSGDRGGHRVNMSSFDRDTLARLCSEPESRLVEICNHYCLDSTVASASFLTCFTDL